MSKIMRLGRRVTATACLALALLPPQIQAGGNVYIPSNPSGQGQAKNPLDKRLPVVKIPDQPNVMVGAPSWQHRETPWNLHENSKEAGVAVLQGAKYTAGLAYTGAKITYLVLDGAADSPMVQQIADDDLVGSTAGTLAQELLKKVPELSWAGPFVGAIPLSDWAQAGGHFWEKDYKEGSKSFIVGSAKAVASVAATALVNAGLAAAGLTTLTTAGSIIVSAGAVVTAKIVVNKLLNDLEAKAKTDGEWLEKMRNGEPREVISDDDNHLITQTGGKDGPIQILTKEKKPEPIHLGSIINKGDDKDAPKSQPTQPSIYRTPPPTEPGLLDMGGTWNGSLTFTRLNMPETITVPNPKDAKGPPITQSKDECLDLFEIGKPKALAMEFRPTDPKSGQVFLNKSEQPFAYEVQGNQVVIHAAQDGGSFRMAGTITKVGESWSLAGSINLAFEKPGSQKATAEGVFTVSRPTAGL